MTSSRSVIVVAALLPPSVLLPLGEPGGVTYPMAHTPGVLRPFSASLSVPMPLTGKHHTGATRPPTSSPTQRSDDGKVVSDTVADTGQDS